MRSGTHTQDERPRTHTSEGRRRFTGNRDGAAACGGASPVQARERVLGHHFVHAWVLHVVREHTHTSRGSEEGLW
jgi:hypothetical protein